MKNSKLIKALTLGIFLSVASVAIVSTSHASGSVNLGAPYVYKPFSIQGLTFASITQLSTPGWTPKTVYVEIKSNDGQSLWGIELWTSGTHYYLNGTSQVISVPYNPTLIQMLFENAQTRYIKTKFWFGG